MIKDSKLIGTKIAAPFGWKKFKVGELFDVCTTTGFDTGKLVFSNEGTPFIGRTNNNYGFQGWVNGMFGVDPNPANVISISQIGSQSAQYRKEPWYASQNMFYVELLDRNLTLYVGLFFVSIFNKLLQQYSGYTSYPTKNSIFDWIIDLPITSANKPDFEWMSAYIKAVNADYLEQKELANQREIKDYLTAGKVDSMDVTDADRQFVRDFEKLPRRKFKVGELFDKIGPVSDQGLVDCVVPFNQDLLSSSVNCATAGVNNNGCPMIAPRNLVNPSFILNLGITVSANGANTGSVFVQTNPFVVLQDSYALVFKRSDLSVEDYLFVASLIAKYKCTFNYQVKAIWSRVSNLEIELPVIDSSQVDVHSIEKYMQIQSKPLINNVVKTLAPVGGGGHF